MESPRDIRAASSLSLRTHGQELSRAAAAVTIGLTAPGVHATIKNFVIIDNAYTARVWVFTASRGIALKNV